MTVRFSRRLPMAAGVGVGAAFWTLVGLWLVPGVISDSYQGRSLGVLNGLISGQAELPLSVYLAEWRVLFLRLTLALAVGGLVVAGLVCWRLPRRTVARLLGTEGQPTARIARVVALGIVVGVGGGILEAGYHGARVGLSGSPISEYTREALWMAPVALSASLLILAAVPLVLWWGRPPVRVAAAILIGTMAYGLIRSLKLGLDGWAVVVLALGLGVLAGRLLEQRWPRVQPRLPAIAGVAIGMVGLLALALGGAERWTEWRRRAGLPEAADRPNVLLLILDTVRARNLSAYGYDRPTSPNLVRLAREGVRFERAVATSSWTLPSHGSMFTGRWRHELRAAWRARMGDEFPTLAEEFAARGYRTVGVVGNYDYAGGRTGLARGFSAYRDEPVTIAMTFRNAWLTRWVLQGFLEWRGYRDTVARKNATRVNTEFLTWLSSGDESRPFFAFLNYFDAHDPYAPPEPYRSRFQTTRDYRYWTSWRRDYTASELAELENAYDGAIAFADAQVGVLLDSLAAMGVLEATIVVVASDHGESFGEHDSRLVGHGNSLYWQSLHVPLILRYPPQIPANRTVPDIVSLRDLPATIADLAFDGSASPFPGTSVAACWSAGGVCTGSPALSEVWPNPGVTQPWDPVAAGPLRSLAQGWAHYIRNARGDVQLFDVAADPAEQVDRSGERALRAVLTSLQEAMEQLTAPAAPRR